MSALRQIWFCFGCVREVPYSPHCGREATRMYSIDLTWKPARPARPATGFVVDPDAEVDPDVEVDAA